MLRKINARYGTWRGLVRTVLAQAAYFGGMLSEYEGIRLANSKRIVFVCLGNICRSAYAEKVALLCGLNATSLGLSTTSGAQSPPEAIAAANRADIDLTSHKATSWEEFEIRAGDIFMAMEVSQARKLRQRLAGRNDVQVSLLGLWCRPAMPHIHDPFTLGADYFDFCFQRVNEAIHRLASADLSLLIAGGAINQMRDATAK